MKRHGLATGGQKALVHVKDCWHDPVDNHQGRLCSQHDYSYFSNFYLLQKYILRFRNISQRERLRNRSAHLKPGMRGPRTGSTMTSESSALPSSAALPWQMAATCSTRPPP